MILQIQKNWISSPLGNHILLAILKNISVQTNNKYNQIGKTLKNKTEYKNETKIFCADTKKAQEQLRSGMTTDDLTKFEENITKSCFWANKKAVEELLKKFKALDTKLVLTNLSTYKDKWQISDTQGAIMTVYNSFSYTEDIKYEARLLELPMQDKDFKFIIIVPNEVDVLSNLYNKLTEEGFTSATDCIQPLFTSITKLKAPNIRFDSELEVTQQYFSSDFCLTTAEFGNVIIDDQGVSINVMTCISPSSKQTERRHPKCDISKNPFYFSLVYNDMTILTGQYIDVCK